MKKIACLILLLVLVFPVFSEQLAVLPELTRPSMMEISGDELFVLDGMEVLVYSLTDFKFLRKFGKQGEGPGELMFNPELPLCMLFDKEHVVLNSFNKMIHFTKAGKMVKEVKLPPITMQAIPFGENYAVTKFTRNTEGEGSIDVILLDGEMKELKTLTTTKLLNSFKKRQIAVPFMSVFIRSASDKLYAFAHQKGLHIDVFDLDGKPLKPVEHAYEKIKVTEPYKKKTFEWLKAQPAFKNVPEELKKMIFFPEYLPVLQHFMVKEGKIYIETTRTEKGKAEFIILDLDGKLLKRNFLPDNTIETIRGTPAANYTFAGDKYYYLVDNADEEEWELHRHRHAAGPS